MSGAAAVSAAKNRRSREIVTKDQKTMSSSQPQKQSSQQTQQQTQKQTETLVELTPLQALHQHDFRIKNLERNLKIINENINSGSIGNNRNDDSNATVNSDTVIELQQTFETCEARILSLEKYIDEELSQSLNLKEKEDKNGEDIIYGKMDSLELLIKELKTELIRIQGFSMETNMAFMKYKTDIDNQLSAFKQAQAQAQQTQAQQTQAQQAQAQQAQAQQAQAQQAQAQQAQAQQAQAQAQQAQAQAQIEDSSSQLSDDDVMSLTQNSC